MWLALALGGIAFACDSGGEATTSAGSGGLGGAGGSGTANGGAGAQLTVGVGGGGGGGPECNPPDLLVVLDRTMSMHREPNGDPAMDTPMGLTQSKWWIAVEAIESAAATYDGGLRLGLELFPRDPGNDACITLQERIAGTTATNTRCEEGEVLVQPDLGTSGAIAQAIDPLTTDLCRSTPIGAGMQTANAALAAIKQDGPDGRDQYALLITDGQDTCDDMLPITEVQAMAQNGVRTYVVGFDASGGSGVDAQQLNDMACAGQTAEGFPGTCIDDGNGNYTWDPNGTPIVYIVAADADDLNGALGDIAAAVCCDCVN